MLYTRDIGLTSVAVPELIVGNWVKHTFMHMQFDFTCNIMIPLLSDQTRDNVQNVMTYLKICLALRKF